MEKSARRRLDCISRHLVLPPQANHGLQQLGGKGKDVVFDEVRVFNYCKVLLLSNGQVKSEEAEPVVLLLLLSNLHNHKCHA
ncbi:unnamed protein product [Prunus armeniaca]|uniref:Uncharacterized protein n=1 Tax=Prunus armeniaca TaxID=36596 RepID=A0A6J5VWH9_PRUAR|nr:unnamed protein product [Prunus armeniaca]CAB4320562.1 unnamed protein product [Prunus armeniaca]